MRLDGIAGSCLAVAASASSRLTAVLLRPLNVVVALIAAVLIAGCAAALPRSVVPQQLADEAELAEMPGVRIWGDASARSLGAMIRAEAPRMVQSRRQEGRDLALNFVAISGGADDGAFGAGLLAGWSDAGTRPSFDLVTGVSAGALIAPFVFLGQSRDHQLKEIFTRYSQEDIYSPSPLSGILGGTALADSTPLENLIARYVDRQFLKDVARERERGRVLLIGTTNLDAQRPVLWDLGRIAMSDHPQALTLFRKVLLASASVPGVFQPVRIPVRTGGRAYDELHVDGGVTQQVFVAPPAVTVGDAGPEMKQIRKRLFIIRNGKINPEWQPVEAGMLSITERSFSTLIKNQGIGDLYRIYATSQRDGVDFNLAAIPPDVVLKEHSPFDPRYMRQLYDVGYRLGRSGYRWMKTPPGLQAGSKSQAAPSPQTSEVRP